MVVWSKLLILAGFASAVALINPQLTAPDDPCSNQEYSEEYNLPIKVNLHTYASNSQNVPTIITTERTDYTGFDEQRELYYTGLDGQVELCFSDTGVYTIKVFAPEESILEELAYVEGRQTNLMDLTRLEDHLYATDKLALETEIVLTKEHLKWGHQGLEFTLYK
jgi:hypothetical protein